MNLTFIKLGGSLITDKSQAYTTRPEMIKQLVAEIAQIHKTMPDVHMVLGTGAGSFAHQSAKKYGTKDGFTDDTGRYGASVVQHDAARLNRIIIEECIQAGLPVISFQPSAWMTAQAGEPSSINLSPIVSALQNNIIPCVYGDVIMDEVQGSTIFSTDTIFTWLIKALEAQPDFEVEKLLNVGHYDGVLDDTGKVIENITPKNFEDIKEHLSGSAHTDVTGGMLAKVEEFLELTKLGVSSYIFNGETSGNIEGVLQSQSKNGTLISAQ
ncbi:MAG: isopentenyl phosphate kinase [Weeksellaceae bacterium]